MVCSQLLAIADCLVSILLLDIFRVHPGDHEVVVHHQHPQFFHQQLPVTGRVTLITVPRSELSQLDRTAAIGDQPVNQRQPQTVPFPLGGDAVLE